MYTDDFFCSELLALVQSASSQGKSRLSELSPVLDVAPTLGPAVENAPSAVVSLESIQPLGDSIVLENLAIRRGNVLHTVTEKNKVVSFPDEASNTASNFSTGMIEAPVSLSKPQRPSRGLVPSRPVIPSKAPQISPSRHLVSPGTVVGSISQQTSRAATDSDHLRIHRHEKGVDGDERPVVEEVTVGASALVVSSEPSPQPRFPTLTHRDSYIQRHPTEIATKPFQLRSSVSSDSDESSFSSDSSSSPNLTLHLGDHDFDVVPLDEEEEDAEGMDLEEAAVVKAYIHHIINSNGHIAPTVDRDASQKLNSPSRTRFEVMPKTRDQHAVQKHNQLPGKNLSSALDLLNAAEAMNRPSQATNPIERIVAERRQRVAGMQATHEFNGIKVNMSGKGFGSERIVETVDYSDIIRTYEMHDNDHLRAEGPRVKASRKGFDNVDLLSRSEGAPRPVLFHAPVSSVPSAMSGHESGKTAGLHNAQSVKGHACAAEERPIAFGDYGLNVDSRHVTMDDEIHRKQTQRLQAGSSSIKRDTIPGPIDAASVMPAFTAIKPSRAAPSVQKYNHPATFLRSHTTGHATGDRHRNQSQVNIRRPAESSATIEVAVPPTRDSTEIERGRESLSDLLARLDQDSRKEAAGSRKEKPLMAPIRVLEPESSHSAHGDNAKRGGPGSTVNSKERLNILLLHPELLPYARPNAQKEGVLQKRHHRFDICRIYKIITISPPVQMI